MNLYRLTLIALLLTSQELAYSQELIDEYPVCIGGSQYVRGTCCMPASYGLPCPYDGTDVMLPPEEAEGGGESDDQSEDETTTPSPDSGHGDGNDGDHSAGDENDNNDDDNEEQVTDDWQITTTMTALPEEASIQTLTDETITENKITETTSEGSSETAVPILVPIIVPPIGPPVICWNCITLPADVQIKVPEFCVRIFGHAIGNCPPGQEDNNDDDHDDEEDEHDDNEEDEDEDDDSECDAELLPGGVVQRNLLSITHRQNNEGGDSCELGAEHVVYPESFDSTVTAAVYAYMLTMITPTGIFAEEAGGIGVLFWRAILTPSQAQDLQDFQGVGFVYEPCKNECYDPTTEIVMQPNSPNDVVVVGQFPTESLAWYRSNYVYHEQGGRDIEVYILDTGANLAHNEITGGSNIASRVRWIHSNPEISTTEDEDGGGKPGHGTCMLSRAAGHRFGIAKHISPVIVRTPTTSVEHYLSGLRRIIDDVGEGKRAVLSMSLYWPKTRDGKGDTQVPLWEKDGVDGYPRIRATMLALFQELTRKGITIVTATGNNDLPKVDGLPASLGDKTARDGDRLDELIVLGAANHEGTERWSDPLRPRLSGSNYDTAKGLPHLYAPGWDVKCPEATSAKDEYGNNIYGHDKYREASGTSLACAATAGLAAYFLSIRDLKPFDRSSAESPMALKNYILELAYNRGGDSSVNLFYNGIHPSDVKGKDTDGPGCPIERRQLQEDDLPDWEDCATPTTFRTTTRNEEPTNVSDDNNEDDSDDDEEHKDNEFDYPVSWTCKPGAGHQCICTFNDCESSDGTLCDITVGKEAMKCGDDCSKCDITIETDRHKLPESIPDADWSCGSNDPVDYSPIGLCLCKRDCNAHEEGDESEICLFDVLKGSLGCDRSCGGCDPSSLIEKANNDNNNNSDNGEDDDEDTWRCRVAYTEDIKEDDYRRWDTCECFKPGCEFGVSGSDGCMRTISQRAYRCGDECEDCEGLD